MQLKVSNLSYNLGTHCLIDNVSFTSQPEVCTAVLGANGAGKSLLLRLCHGLLQPTVGSVRWNDKTPSLIAQKITMVFQNPVLLSRSAIKNIEHALYLKGIPRAKRRTHALYALERVGLVDTPSSSSSVLHLSHKKDPYPDQ